MTPQLILQPIQRPGKMIDFPFSENALNLWVKSDGAEGAAVPSL